MFGFLFLVFTILVVICSEATILLSYLGICVQRYVPPFLVDSGFFWDWSVIATVYTSSRCQINLSQLPDSSTVRQSGCRVNFYIGYVWLGPFFCIWFDDNKEQAKQSITMIMELFMLSVLTRTVRCAHIVMRSCWGCPSPTEWYLR